MALRYKQFTGSSSELEGDINSWLEQFEPDITQMTQTVGDNGMLAIGFLYEESFRGQEKRLSAEHRLRVATPPVTPDEPIQVRADPP